MIQDLFDSEARKSILERLDRLAPTSPRQWGKMTAPQMLAHCAVPIDLAIDGNSRKQKLIGRLLSPFVRKRILGAEPFSRNSPTDPDFVIRDDRDFATEKARLAAAIERFAEHGPKGPAFSVHPFFGRLSGNEWGCLMYKHLDHHLRQFGA